MSLFKNEKQEIYFKDLKGFFSKKTTFWKGEGMILKGFNMTNTYVQKCTILFRDKYISPDSIGHIKVKDSWVISSLKFLFVFKPDIFSKDHFHIHAIAYEQVPEIIFCIREEEWKQLVLISNAEIVTSGSFKIGQDMIKCLENINKVIAPFKKDFNGWSNLRIIPTGEVFNYEDNTGLYASAFVGGFVGAMVYGAVKDHREKKIKQLFSITNIENDPFLKSLDEFITKNNWSLYINLIFFKYCLTRSSTRPLFSERHLRSYWV